MITWARLIGFEIRSSSSYWFNWAGREQELAGLSSDRTSRVQLVQSPITLSSFCITVTVAYMCPGISTTVRESCQCSSTIHNYLLVWNGIFCRYCNEIYVGLHSKAELLFIKFSRIPPHVNIALYSTVWNRHNLYNEL